jgi:hypothetical protein
MRYAPARRIIPENGEKITDSNHSYQPLLYILYILVFILVECDVITVCTVHTVISTLWDILWYNYCSQCLEAITGTIFNLVVHEASC